MISRELLNESSWGDSNGKRWEDYDSIVCPDGQVIDMAKLLDDQQRAKAALVHILPMFGGLVGRLRFIYTFRVSTQATDGFNVYVNPQFTYNIDLTGKVFVMAHEIMHCLLQHMRRGKGHDPERSNIAADYEVNQSLVDLDLVKGSWIEKFGGLYDDKYKNWGYEKIYDSNPKKGSDSKDMNNDDQSQKAKNQQEKQKGSSGSGNSDKQTYSDDYKAGWAQAVEDYKNGKLKL